MLLATEYYYPQQETSMSIAYNARLGTYVAQDSIGQVVAIYNPNTHGSVDEFRNAMAHESAA